MLFYGASRNGFALSVVRRWEEFSRVNKSPILAKRDNRPEVPANHYKSVSAICGIRGILRQSCLADRILSTSILAALSVFLQEGLKRW
jgi:hypothetical protein